MFMGLSGDPAASVYPVSSLGELKSDSQNARDGVYEWKTALVFALRMHSSQPLKSEPAVWRRKLDMLPSER